MSRVLPLQVSFRDIPRSDELESFVGEQADHFLGHLDITSCQVLIEQPHKHSEHGRPWHVRVEIGAPRLDNLVVIHHQPAEANGEKLHAAIKDTLSVAKRRMTKLLDKRDGKVKRHRGAEAR